MVRWVFNFYFFSIRVHHWISSDDPRHFHDHPWWFISWVLKGSYIDRSPSGDAERKEWSVALKPALHRHTVIVPKGGCWTIMLTGKEKRAWGFWVDGKFKKRNRYFYDYRHHPCD
jgi:hypothetical protein